MAFGCSAFRSGFRRFRQWQGLVTPSGLESVPGTTKPSETEPSPTESPGPVPVPRILTRRVCSKCSKAAQLAMAAANAVRNCDFYRAFDLLEEICTLCGGAAAQADAGKGQGRGG